MHDRTFTIVDVETTGGDPRFSRIIEIGAVRVEHGEIVSRYETLINPGATIPKFITGLTGIKDSDVEGAPLFDDVKEDLLELFEGSVFVAHNASFDHAFITAEFKRHGYGFTVDTLCSVRLSRILYPQHKRHNLDEIIKRFAISCERRHRALDDALVVWEFMQKLDHEFPSSKVKAALKRLIKEENKRTDPRCASNLQDIVYEPIMEN